MTRSVLALVCLACLLSAGCASAPDGGTTAGPSTAPTATAGTTDRPTTATGPAPPSTNRSTDGDLVFLPANVTVFETVRVGDESDLRAAENPANTTKQRFYQVWNDAPANRSLSVTVWRNRSVVVNQTRSFPANGALRVTVYRHGNYTVVVETPAGTRGVVRDAGALDCNRHTVNVRVGPDGAMATVHRQTTLFCG